jgi:hypothetical protein
MEYYLYYSPDFEEEYFVEKIKKSTLFEIYEKMKNYLSAWYGEDILSFDKFASSDKITISYPNFNYNRVIVNDYPWNLREHMDMALNLIR